MGKNNKQRRAAKARKRRTNGYRPPSASGAFRAPESPLSDADLVEAAVLSERSGITEHRDAIVHELASRPAEDVAPVIAARLTSELSRLWDDGWQPADLERVTRWRLGQAEVEVVCNLLAVDSAWYEQWGWAVAPEWMEQLAELEVERWWEPDEHWLTVTRGPWVTGLTAAIRTLNLFLTLPDVQVLTPPPSEWGSLDPTRRLAGRLDGALLAKVRALLAKAESTSFEAEAEAFTAKAQELMTRHRIDSLDAEPSADVVGRRIGIENPYPEARSLLLGGVASANGCRAVWTKHLGFATVYGYPEDLDGVEALFTSLLVQATVALRGEGSRTDRYGRSRTTQFRRSFLVAFASRISDRLRTASDDVVAEAENERGVALVPLLAARDRAAEEALRRDFSGLKKVGVSARDAEGWALGTEAADRADLEAATRARIDQP